jgi:predicted O-methyltransferase YrrM
MMFVKPASANVQAIRKGHQVTPKQILELVQLPATTRLKYGQILYEFLTESHLSNGLELRSSPGIGTVYLAGAIEAQGTGKLRSVCQKMPQEKSYDTRTALQRTGLESFVTLYEEQGCYSWRMMKFLQEDQFEQYDFCLIDGGQTWSEVGFACCLAERMLKPGGWIFLDNIGFSFRESRIKNKKWVTSKQEDEQTTRQVQCVFELLVQNNPHFGTFLRRSPLAMAQKRQAVWSSKLREQNKIEAFLYDAVERARHDPEFREELMNTPRHALSFLPNSIMDNLKALRIIETDQIVPRIQYEDSQKLIVYLDKPAWDVNIDENALNEMLKSQM